MKEMKERISSIKIERDQEINKVVNEEIFQHNFELNNIITEFCTKVCGLYSVPDDDTGPLDSSFCGKLEKTVEQLMREFYRCDY